MSFLLPVLQAGTPGPTDDFWYQPAGVQAVTGHRVTPDMAMRVSTVYAAMRVKSTVMAMLPLQVFETREDGGKDRLPDHRLSSVLAHPNEWQTGYQLRQLMAAHVTMWGNGICEILPGARGFVDQLVPLHPAHVTLKDQMPDGRLVYEYMPPDGHRPRILRTGEVLHVMGPSHDGRWGLSVLSLMRDAVGLALATQEHGGRQFGGNSPMMKGILTSTGPVGLKAEQEKQLTQSFARAHSGANAHGVAYLPPGLDWQSVGMSNEDAQFLETRDFQVSDLLRFMAVPGVLVGHGEKTATYASAEQFFQSFVTYHLDPDFVAMEKAIGRDLLEDGERDRVFVKHNRNALLRGDASSRSEFYGKMVELGIYTRNEVRAFEDINPLDGLDEPLTPLNMQQGTGDTPPPASAAGGFSLRAQAILQATAARLGRREVATMQKAAERHAANPDAWRKAVTTFYDKFAGDVASSLAVDTPSAAAFCAARATRLLATGAGLLEHWDHAEGAALAAIGEDSCDTN